MTDMNTGTTKNPDECNDKNKDITDNTKTLGILINVPMRSLMRILKSR